MGAGVEGGMGERRGMKATVNYVIVENALRQCHLNRRLS